MILANEVVTYHLFPCGIFVLKTCDGFFTEIVPDDAFDRCLGPVSSSVGEALLRDSINLRLEDCLDTGIVVLSVGMVCLENKYSVNLSRRDNGQTHLKRVLRMNMVN